RAAHQASVDVLAGHQAVDVVRLDAAAVENPHAPSQCIAELLSNFLTNKAMRLFGDLRSGGAARTNSPDRLVSNDYTRELVGGQSSHTVHKLCGKNSFRAAGLALIERFADANDRREALFESSQGALEDGGVGLAEVLAALAVS